MSDDVEYRNRLSLKPGSKITTLIAAACAVIGVYQLFNPTFFPSVNGNIPCGSGLRKPPSKFASNICNGAQHHELALALLFFGLALSIGILGLLFYGMDRRVEIRPVRDYDEYDDVRPRRTERETTARRGEERGGSTAPRRRRYEDEDDSDLPAPRRRRYEDD